jgi:hypothetical protein
MGWTELVLCFGIIYFNSVSLGKDKDNFFHHRDDEETGFFSQDTPQNNLFGIFNKSQSVIFVNNPDLLKEHHTHSFESEAPSSSESVSDVPLENTGECDL